MVGELITKKEHERKSYQFRGTATQSIDVDCSFVARAYAVMPFVWSIGTIIGPAIGGTFARPSVSMPSFFSSTGIFATVPYLLPNLICAGLLSISIILGYFCLTETHPDMQAWSTQEELDNTTADTPLLGNAGATTAAPADLRDESYGTFNAVEISSEKEWNLNADGTSISSPRDDEPKVFCRKIIMIVVALGIFTYHSMTYDHLLPIFFQDTRIIPQSPITPFSIPGGLGLTTQNVGIIMSINGLIALFIQAVIFPLFAAWLGIWKTFVLVTILHPIAYLLVPYLAFLPANTLYTGIWICLTIRNFTSILAYPVLLILLKEATPTASCLGKVNGLAASAGAACRTIAPPIAGYLYGLGANIGFTGLAWWGSAFVAIIGVVQLLTMKRTKNKTATIRPVASCQLMRSSMQQEGHDVVHINVRDTAEEEEVAESSEREDE